MTISTFHSGMALAPMIDCGHISGTSCVSVNNQTTRSGIHCNDQTNVGHQHIDLHGREAVNKTLAGADVSGVDISVRQLLARVKRMSPFIS
jgi:hypothetical protein